MKKFSALILTLILCLTQLALSASVHIGWTNPTENENGTPLTDLAGSMVYWGIQSSNYTARMDVPGATVNTCIVTGLTEGVTYYMAGTAYNTHGVESTLCPEIQVDIPYFNVARLIIDNTNQPPFFFITGSWTSSTVAPRYWATDYLASLPDPTNSVTFVPMIVANGTYDVAIWYTAHANRASNVPVTITCNTGSVIKTVNQQINGSQWLSLGTYPFNKGITGKVKISAQWTYAKVNGYVIADAVRLTPIFTIPKPLTSLHKMNVLIIPNP